MGTNQRSLITMTDEEVRKALAEPVRNNDGFRAAETSSRCWRGPSVRSRRPLSAVG